MKGKLSLYYNSDGEPVLIDDEGVTIAEFVNESEAREIADLYNTTLPIAHLDRPRLLKYLEGFLGDEDTIRRLNYMFGDKKNEHQ